MKCFLLLGAVLLSPSLLAKKPTMYHCKQKNGTTVIQDRRCEVTRLQQAQPSKSLSRNPQSKKIKDRRSQFQIKKNIKSGQLSKRSKLSRSKYFSLGWDKFIPLNWQLQKINTDRYDQLLLSMNRFKGIGDFKEGVTLTVYADTMKFFRQGAFAEALKYYHQIRANNQYQLLDSQFKSHPNFKVFNIKYMLNKSTLALTEFYIDERSNDLFVVTVQSRQSKWQPNWQFAEQLINQL